MQKTNQTVIEEQGRLALGYKEKWVIKENRGVALSNI
jgi:hypothetical protein